MRGGSVAGGGLRQKHKRRRIQEVLDAAEVLFNEQGYEATRIETIADSASVAPATVYNYFVTKSNLLAELTLRHVRSALPERRAYLQNLPADIVTGVLGFERLLAEQAMRHLSRECWRAILAAQHLEPGGRASRIGVRLNTLIKRHYLRMLTIYRDRGVLRDDVDIPALSNLIVGITTHDFSTFVASENRTIEDLLEVGVPHIQLILEGLVTPSAPPPRSADAALE